MVHIRSKLHDPKNAALAKECIECCDKFDHLQFSGSELLQSSVRSNRTGESLTKSTHSLSSEVINTILASRCDWSEVIGRLAVDLQRTGRRGHNVALFGIGDSVPLSPFQQHELEITKLDVLSLTSTATLPNPMIHPQDSFPTDAIAIIGAACRLPGANSLEELWDVISHGESRVESLREDRVNLKESFRASQDKEWASKRAFYGNFIDDVDAFDHPFFGTSPREATYMDPQQRLLLATAFEAMDSSGYLRRHQREDGDAVGCFLGASYTEYLENTSAYSPSAFTATGTIRAFLSGKISYHFGWTGPSEVIDTACSASLVAIHRACRAIQAGECPMALAGGVNVITGINNYFDLGKANFLSPTGQCKPFDDSADGYCRADGVGLVVLKPLSKAVAEGDHIMGVISASATNQGGLGSPGITVPDGRAQKALYKSILTKAGVGADQVSYVEAHGTGTQVGDPIEIDSVRQVFGGPQRTAPLHVGSLKANIGHSETAAGVASLLKVLTMLSHQSIPPLQGFKRLNHKISALEPEKLSIPTRLIPWDADPRVACINSYGASGSNSALLCSEWLGMNSNPLNSSADASAPIYPVLLSAASRDSLQRYANDLVSYILKSPAGMTLGNVAFTLSERRKYHRVRWSTTASDLSNLVERLRTDIRSSSVEVPKNTKKVVLAFSGQSKTNIGLDPNISQTNPRFKEYIRACGEILQTFGCPDILPALSQPGPISDPVLLQCGTSAVQYACAKCWIDGGLKVDAVVGHSLGELTALAVSGAISLADALRVVYQRAELMKTKWGPERGTMLAIHAKLDTVRSIMDVVETTTNSQDGALEIACYNSLTSHVVVGKQASVAMAERIIGKDPRYHGIRHQRLDVSHGFHSRFTEPLLDDLTELTKTLDFKEPTIALELSTQNQSWSKMKNARYFADHAREPVYFVDAVRRLEQKMGPCVWLEAGWNTPIVAMTKKAVAQPQLHTFQAVTSPAISSANLWQEGITNSFWGFLSPMNLDLRQIWLPPYNFDRPKYWLDHVDRAIEEQKASQTPQNINQHPAEKKVTQLLSYKGPIGSHGLSHQFCLHTTTERYTRIVKGHAVRQKPLCPASMYMEAAAMGAVMLGVELRGKTITFQNIAFHRPLGCDDDLDVQLCLDRHAESEGDSWHYVVQSSSKTTHSEGDFSASTSANPDFQLYELLVSDQIKALKNDPNAERLMTRTAYSLFSRVVDYGDLLQGISNITLGTKQAVAQIKVPSTTFTNSESTVSEFFDAITLDTFVQVLGLLINCSGGSSSSDEIYVASIIDKMVVLPTEFRIAQTWTVYATYTAADSKQSSGAIFVFSEAGELTAIGTRIRFTKIQAAKLERVLEAANPRVSTASATPTTLATEKNTLYNEVLSREIVTSRATERSIVKAKFNEEVSTAQVLSQKQESIHDKTEELKSLISTCTGINMADIQDDESLGSMGVDSLATMELADELKSKLGIEVSTEDLLTGDVRSLSRFFPSTHTSITNNRIPIPLANGYECRSESSTSSRHSSGATTPDDHLTGLTTPANFTTGLTTPADYGLPSNANGHIKESDSWKRPKNPLSTRHKVETIIYKVIDCVEIPADLFIPLEAPSQQMPIGMIS
jgi:acyl transferase domain-containing protein/acyl carrier protein